MSLVALLKENPSAQIEYEAALKEARAEGETKAKDEMKAVVAKVSPILKSPDYDESVKAFGAEVIMGEKTMDGLDAIVFMADKENEAAKAAAAATETDENGETPGASGDGAEDAEAKFKEKQKRIQAGG